MRETSVDKAMRELVAEAVSAMVRSERDRLARIMLRHGLSDIARDVEYLNDEGDGPDACPECEGRGHTTRYVGDSDRQVPCAACGETGQRAPRVTA